MSYKIWIEDKQQPNGYLERDQAPENLQPRFNELTNRLAATGHYVVLVHGGSVRAQEVFFFERPNSARIFYKTGLRAFERRNSEYNSGEGFYKVELYVDGWWESIKAVAAESDMWDHRVCPQCGFPRAGYDYSRQTNRHELWCSRCGFDSVSYSSFDDKGRITRHYETKEGFGVLVFVRKDGDGRQTSRAISSEEDGEGSANWLRQQIATGEVCAIGSYVTRWNSDDKKVDFVVGTERLPTYMPGVESV